MKRRNDPKNLMAAESSPSKRQWLLAICWGLIGAVSYWMFGTFVEQSGIARVQAQSNTPPADTEEVDGPQDDSIGGLLEGLDLKSSVDGESGQKPQQIDQGETKRSADEPDAVAVTLGKVRDEMLAAGRLLASDEFGESTQQHQQEVVDLIDSLLNAFETGQQAGQSTEAASEGDSDLGQKVNGDEGEAGAQTQSEGESRDSNAAIGSESESGQESGDANVGESDGEGAGQGNGESEASHTSPVRRPLNVRGEAIWGHLPEQRRGLLRAETPTEYLPQYADQISRYFEALAEIAQKEDR